jgi:hypothetical protein
MAIDAVFQHEDGCKYNEVFTKRSKFLSAIKRRSKDVFVHAVDYDKHFIIYPSTIPEYRRLP